MKVAWRRKCFVWCNNSKEGSRHGFKYPVFTQMKNSVEGKDHGGGGGCTLMCQSCMEKTCMWNASFPLGWLNFIQALSFVYQYQGLVLECLALPMLSALKPEHLQEPPDGTSTNCESHTPVWHSAPRALAAYWLTHGLVWGDTSVALHTACTWLQLCLQKFLEASFALLLNSAPVLRPDTLETLLSHRK